MANSTKRTRFSRRLPDHVTDELVNALTIKKTYEFNSLFEAVYEQLKLRNAVSGGEEMLRLRAYEKLQNLVSRGLVEKIGKTYRGLEGVQNARTPIMPPNTTVIIPMPVAKAAVPITILKAPSIVTEAPLAVAKAPAVMTKTPARKSPVAATKRKLVVAKARIAAKATAPRRKPAKTVPKSKAGPAKAASAAAAKATKVGTSKIRKVTARKYK